MNESEQTKPRRTWTYPWETGQGIFWSVSYLLMVAFAYFMPLDVLDKYPPAKEFTDFMANWNMQIRRVGEISGPANQVNRFVYSVLWCVMPVYWVMFFRVVYLEKRDIGYIVQAKSWTQYWIAFGGCAFMLYGGITLSGDIHSWIGKFMFTFSIGRSIFAPWMVLAVGLLAVFFPYLAWAFMTNLVTVRGNKNG